MNFSCIARSFIRNYMFGRTRLGRSTCKKLLLPLLPQWQQVELEAGLSMYLDLSKTNHQFLFWFYEEHESSLQWAIKTLFPSKGIFIDCGANLGLMGLLAIYYRQARVVFIEPHPRLAGIIQKNLELNQFASEAKVCEVAASKEDGHAFLSIDSISDGGHSLAVPYQANGSSLSMDVKTQRLETLLRELSMDHVHFLKIDAEGYDFHVLDGLGHFLLPQNIDLIYIEMGGDYSAIWNLLLGRGYRPFAAETIYIDRLRQLQRKGDSSQFFFPIEKEGDGNLLWCGRGSTYERFLLEACRSKKN